MDTAGVAELKARLAQYLKQVKSGNEILLLQRFKLRQQELERKADA